MIRINLILLCILAWSAHGQKLILLSVLHRHGERTPEVFYPNDPHKHDHWARDPGQLTNEGKRQVYALGQFIRKRYGYFISERYNSEKIYYRSSDIDRTLMSAQLVAAGLFHPNENNIWGAGIMWDPTPVHTVALKEDYLLYRYSNCSRYFKLYQEALSVPPISTLIRDHQPFFDVLTKQLGFEVNFVNLWKIYDGVSGEIRRNITEPKWLRNIWGEMVSINNQQFGLFAPTREMQRLKAGPFLKEVVEHCKRKISKNITLNTFVYSAHDLTLGTILEALSVFNGKQPPYASVILVELYDLGDISADYGNYAIRFLYRNSSSAEPYILQLPGCDNTMCRFDRFIDIVEDLIPGDIIEECSCACVSMPALNQLYTMIHLGLLLLLLSYVNGQKLALISAVHRHGERTPTDFYPDDPHAHDYWPRSVGQLTNEGKRQEYELGRFFRKQYGDFIGTRYFANKTYYRSTDVDRTLMSAQLVCAGLFPPQKDDVWNSELMWQPIPIHTVSGDNDYLLSRSCNCPKFYRLQAEALKVPPVSTVIRKYQPLFDSLSEHLKYEVNFSNIWEIYDDVSKEMLRNMSEPKWLMDIWSDVISINNQEFGLMVPSREMQRLKAGPFLKDIIEHCRMKINKTAVEKIFLYSAHDTTLSIILDALSVYNGLQPPYGSAIIIELHDLGEGSINFGDYALKFLYRNSSVGEPYPLLIPGCGSTMCKFLVFTNLVSDLIPEDIVSECENPKIISSSSFHYLAIIMLCFIGFLLIICFTLWRITKSMKRVYVGLQPLINDEK
ncbi:Testicular acid phosphatase [Nymphon striatum]|nr:Testicular acid phosphatase [Nymphon striatum]